MKGRLAADIDFLVDINSARQDNILHFRLILSRYFETHRGQKDVMSAMVSDNKTIQLELTRLQLNRCAVEQKIVERFRNWDVDANNKNVLFGLLSRTQKTIKIYYNKLLVSFPKLADFLNADTCEFQNEMRQLALERMSGEKKIGSFFEEFQKCLAARFKKQLARFCNFYNYYGCLIDKRAQKEEVSHLKIQKYLALTTKDSVLLATKFYMYSLNRNKNGGTGVTSTDLYGITDLDDTPVTGNYNSANYQNQQNKEEGFCDQYANKMDRTFKQLLLRNAQQQKVINRFILQCRLKETQAMRSGKSKDKKPSSNQRRFRSNKSVNGRSVSESNDSGIQAAQQLPTPPSSGVKVPVVRQTLLQMNINEKTPLPHLSSHFRLTEFPSNSFNFYKDKLNKTQLLMLFRKRFPVILKQNV